MAAANYHYAYIHRALPKPLPQGAIVADVELEPLPEGDYRPHLVRHGIRARVRRMVQGSYNGEFMLVRPVYWTSCDSIFENGRAGFLVAVPRRTEGGTLVVDPIKVSNEDGYRLPDGFKVSRETFKHAELPPLSPVQQGPPLRSARFQWLAVLLSLLVGTVSGLALLKRRRG
jgi:hypothetical protein